MTLGPIMHSAGAFMLRLPEAAVGEAHSDTSEWTNVEPGKMYGVFPESTWRILGISEVYGPGILHKMCALPQPRYHEDSEDTTYRCSGEVLTIMRALQEVRPRRWCVVIQSPEKEGTLAAIDWMHKLATELSYGGVVEPNGCWCLYVTGKSDEPAKVDWTLPAKLNDCEVSEHLRIAVAEGSTMLVQMLIEQRW